MMIIRGKGLQFIPVEHEDSKDPGAFKKVLFKKEELSNGNIQMINWAKLLAGRTMNSHTHDSMDEIFIILSGSVRIKIEDEEDELGAGDTVFIPARTIHEMKALGESDVLYIVIGIV